LCEYIHCSPGQGSVVARTYRVKGTMRTLAGPGTSLGNDI